MSKWVETAISPVPERSHMLKTRPTKAGPPFPADLTPRYDVVSLGDEDEGQSAWVDSKGKGGGGGRDSSD